MTEIKTVEKNGSKVLPLDESQLSEEERADNDLSPAEQAGKTDGGVTALKEILDEKEPSPEKIEENKAKIKAIGDALVQGKPSEAEISTLMELSSRYPEAGDALNRIKETEKENSQDSQKTDGQNHSTESNAKSNKEVHTNKSNRMDLQALKGWKQAQH